jgi:NTP pyrophosphatase (non-canonical NTP hydrolase)
LLDDLESADTEEEFEEVLIGVVVCCDSYESQMFALNDKQKQAIAE